MNTKEEIISSLTTPRQDMLNQLRWLHFLSMDIPLEGKIIFEPGAGIGDQTQWLLDHGAKHIYVNDGRPGNLQVIHDRFGNDPRLTFVEGNLESPGDMEKFRQTITGYTRKVDLIFCYGVYYHVKEAFPRFPIMKGLAEIGEMIALDYLTGDDNIFSYGYDNPSTSISQYAYRPRTSTLLRAMKYIWGYSYLPKDQLKWCDPVAPETRLIAVGSHSLLDNPKLEPWNNP